MKTITRNEELILMSILQLGENAYLVAIQEYLSKVIHRNISLTSVHLPLSRLETGKLVESFWGESTAIRGGRRKKIYRITRYGFEALEEYKRIHDALWRDYTNLATS
jgi:DNA-binding PadR family transcriptional regulator